MSQLDAELADAIERSEANAPAAVVAAPPIMPRRKGSPGLLVGLLVTMLALFGFVMMYVEGIRSKGVDEIVKERTRLVGRHVRMDGTLVTGTLMHREQPCEYRFDLKKNGKRIAVRFPGCIVPDTFKDMPDRDVNVHVEGALARAGHFQASKIEAKCPSKYEERSRRGEAAPHRSLTTATTAPASI